MAMASTCIGDCVNSDVICVGTGTTYAKIHKWPAAEADFVRSLSHGDSHRCTASVNSILCRQMYLRSYKFSRKEETQYGDCDVAEADDPIPINDRRCFGGGKKVAATRRIGTSKTTLHKSLVVKFLLKCVSCSFPPKVNQ